MTQEDKHLLLVDLCARLPYGVIMKGVNEDFELNASTSPKRLSYVLNSADFKPYLRPMSSMTEEEKEYIKNRWCYSDWDIAGPSSLWREKIEVEDAEWIIDYFNEHHFDYRNLIFKGLALEAPEGMY